MVTAEILEIKQQTTDDGEGKSYVVEFTLPETSETFETQSIPADAYDQETVEESIKEVASDMVPPGAVIEVEFPVSSTEEGPVNIDRRQALVYGSGLATALLLAGGGWWVINGNSSSERNSLPATRSDTSGDSQSSKTTATPRETRPPTASETSTETPTPTQTESVTDTSSPTPEETPTLTPTETPSLEYGVSVTFDSTSDSASRIEELSNWEQDEDGHLYTWSNAGDSPNQGRPTKTVEDTDYTKDYYEHIGGNFLIQQAGGSEKFSSSFTFSNYPVNYTDAPYKPSELRIRVGGNTIEEEHSGEGWIQLSDNSDTEILKFYFESADATGKFMIKNHVVESDHNNGLYQIVLQNINWNNRRTGVKVYRQTQSGYESTPIFNRNPIYFNGKNLDTIRLHAKNSAHAYLDAIYF